MYAKLIVPAPDGLNVPFIVATTTTSNWAQLKQVLTTSGWTVTPQSPASYEIGTVEISTSFTVITANEVVLHDEINPVAPEGWWPALDQRGGKCTLIIVDGKDIDFDGPNVGVILSDIIETGRGLWAVLTVKT